MATEKSPNFYKSMGRLHINTVVHDIVIEHTKYGTPVPHDDGDTGTYTALIGAIFRRGGWKSIGHPVVTGKDGVKRTKEDREILARSMSAAYWELDISGYYCGVACVVEKMNDDIEVKLWPIDQDGRPNKVKGSGVIEEDLWTYPAKIACNELLNRLAWVLKFRGFEERFYPNRGPRLANPVDEARRQAPEMCFRKNHMGEGISGMTHCKVINCVKDAGRIAYTRDDSGYWTRGYAFHYQKWDDVRKYDTWVVVTLKPDQCLYRQRTEIYWEMPQGTKRRELPARIVARKLDALEKAAVQKKAYLRAQIYADLRSAMGVVEDV